MSAEEEAAEEAAAAEAAPEIEVERIYTVPLREAYEAVRKRRTKRAVNILRRFIKRHMKPEEDTEVVIDPALNEYLWARGIEKPPRRVRVRATKDKLGVVRVYLAEAEAG